jgi:uncharacterized membrane protein (UPF0182 family)
MSLRGIASFYTDYLWFDSLDHGAVFTGVLQAKITLVALFTAGFFVLLWVNLLVTDRWAPTFRPAGAEDELVARYRALVGTRKGWVYGGVSALFALIAGAPASSQWRQWMLFNNSVDFDVSDPLFDRDVGFYVFRLPFLSYVVDWLFAALVIVLVITAAFHYLNGGIRVQAPASQRVTPQVKVHLSVLLALLALVKAAGYWLQRFGLTTSTRGTVDGATYTDANAQLPAINLLVLIALAAAVLFLLNIRRKGWVLPVLGTGIWAVVAIVGGAIVPAVVQRFRVEPAEFSREREYIVDNIEATRAAMGLDGVVTRRFAGEAELTEADLFANADVIANIRLWDTGELRQTYQQLQALRPFYSINDVDVDRYEIDGELAQVMISARELESEEVPQQSWEATHLSFTHGYGVVMSPANSKEATGRPDLVVSDVPVRDRAGLGLEPERAGVYFGENLSGYVIVGTDRPEIDFQDEEGASIERNYDGADGVGIGSWLRRAAFALRFGDFNPLFSGNLRGESRILYNRDIRERVEALAPFLDFDQDPYPVVMDGDIKWVLDAYTTTDRYPYAQRAVLDGLDGSDLDHRFNYIRNSVKAVVDAYDGTVTFYVVDPDDPIVRAWSKAFPDLFSTEEPPEELRAHFRYPEDMFRVQTNMWGRYHIGPENPADFFNNVGAWTVAADPGLQEPSAGAATTTTTTDPTAPPTERNRIEPYYLLTRLPGDTDQSFVLLRPYVPIRSNRPVLTAFLVANSDPDDYGELVSYETPPTASIDGPAVVAATISNDTRVSEDQTDLCQRGTRCKFGNLVFVPIEESLLYVQPLYITAEGNDVPLLRKVIVEYNGQVGYADTLQEALLQLFDAVPETREETGPVQPGGEPGEGEAEETPADVLEMLEEAQQLFDEAYAALEDGPAGLTEFAERLEDARELIEQARTRLEGEAEAGAEGGGASAEGSAGAEAEPGAEGEGEGAAEGETTETTATTGPPATTAVVPTSTTTQASRPAEPA